MAVISLASQPVGVRLSPTDVEIVNHYLLGKIQGRESEVKAIKEVSLCKFEPRDLADRASVTRPGDMEWFFFSPRGRKYPKGNRSNRATNEGYWKSTGKDRRIKYRKKVIGTKKTLVFHRGRAPDGVKTPWIIHEYQIKGEQASHVLCRLFYKPEEEKASSNCDEVNQKDLLPNTSTSSPNNSQHAGEALLGGQFDNTSLNQRTSELNIQESPQSLLKPIGDQLVHIEKMLNESEGVKSDPSIPEETKEDFLQEYLRVIIDPPKETLDPDSLLEMHLMHSELQMSSRMLCHDDHNAKYIGLPPYDTVEQAVAPDRYEREFIDSILNSDGGYSCVDLTSQKDSIQPRSLKLPCNEPSISSITLQSESLPGEGSESSSFADANLLKSERRWYSDLEASRWGHKPETNVGVHVSSADSYTENIMFMGIEESPSHKYLANSGNDIDDKRIGLITRARQPQSQAISHNTVAQGFAMRRIRLQSNFHRESALSEGGKSIRDTKDHQKIKQEDVEDTIATGSGVSDLVESLKSWKPLQSWK